MDVGINMVTNDRITAMMLEMAAADDKLQQSTAAELIVHTVSKHERATTILKVSSILALCSNLWKWGEGGECAMFQQVLIATSLRRYR